ncbi:MAG TPA: DUF6265 family protein [Casimicrobiaceae bacterium]
MNRSLALTLPASLLAACTTMTPVVPGAPAAPAAQSHASQAPATAPGAPPPASAAAAGDSLAPLAWLQGCWHGNVNQRDFSEQWSAPAAGTMVGIGRTVMQGRTLDSQHLRIESRPDGVFYVATADGKQEQRFRLVDTEHDEASGAETFTFDNVAAGFPRHITYRRGAEGWLYAGIDGTLSGQERKVLYPMRHVSCESGDLLAQ